MKNKNKKKRSNARIVINVVLSILATFLVIRAIREQLRLPPGERTWHGTISGVPYDFRRPTAERLRATFWNKDTSQLLVPQAFGLGWTINFYPLVHPQTSQSQSLEVKE
jgi:hypothetical protein